MWWLWQVIYTKQSFEATSTNTYWCSSVAFQTNGNLKRHKLIHTGDRQHKCVFCGKTFIQSNKLKQHLITHTGVKLFKYVFCKVKFCHRTPLKLQNLNRYDKHLYQCNSFDGSFTTLDNVDKNQRTLFNDKLFYCKFCNKNFQRKNCLVLHEPKHLRVKTFKC